MKAKIGRNSPCYCGSDKKYKKCCGAPAKQEMSVEISERAVAAYRDKGSGQMFVFTKDMVVNQLQRMGPQIAASFDRAFVADIHAISEQSSFNFALLFSCSKDCLRKNEELGVECAQLLLNASQTITCALEVIRHGFRLQPGILIRNAIETICVAVSLFVEPSLLAEHNGGRLDSTKTISTAKKAIPPLGRLYGFFSQQFAHLGQMHRAMHSWDSFESSDEGATMNLRFIKLAVNLITISSELVFYDWTENHRYWQRINEGGYEFNPSPQERLWQEKFLDVAEPA
jgi:hypothetical protein